MRRVFVQRIRLLLVASVLSSFSWVRADTIINGGNLMTTTWTTSGSPFIIRGDVSVAPGATLTIEAGVEVRCAAFDMQAAGRDPSRVELTINGSIHVKGTAASPVVFKGQTAGAGSWYGIVSASGASVVTFSDANIQHSVVGLSCENLSGVRAIGLSFSTNRTAISVAAGNFEVEGSRVFGNETAIEVRGSGSVSIEKSVVYGNTSQGFQINATGNSASFNVVNCTIHGNGTYGFYLGTECAATVNIRNTIITGCDYGLYRALASQGSVSVDFSDVWGNSTNFVNVIPGAQAFSEDPLYIDVDGRDNLFGNADDNLHLQPNSPCGFEGNDGSDLGAYVIQKVFILPPEFVGEDVRLRFGSISNRTHQLQFTEDLNAWSAVGSGVLSEGGILSLTNFGARALPKRFYRVRLDD